MELVEFSPLDEDQLSWPQCFGVTSVVGLCGAHRHPHMELLLRRNMAMVAVCHQKVQKGGAHLLKQGSTDLGAVGAFLSKDLRTAWLRKGNNEHSGQKTGERTDSGGRENLSRRESGSHLEGHGAQSTADHEREAGYKEK